jgi:GntR family transcriptional regulator
MLLELDPTSGEPLYRQIETAIHRAVRIGEVRSGDRLPAARDLARSLGVNMHTVLRAYNDLREQGLIEMRRGRGAVVVNRLPDVAGLLPLVRNLVAQARRSGLGPGELKAMIDEEFA